MSFNQMTNARRLKILNSSDPISCYREIELIYNKTGKVLDPKIPKILQGRALDRTRKEYGVNPNTLVILKPHLLDDECDTPFDMLSLQAEFMGLKLTSQMINESECSRREKIILRDKYITTAFDIEQRAKAATKRVQDARKARQRTWNENAMKREEGIKRLRDIDKFADREIKNSRRSHAPRAGNRVHPQQAQQLRRKERELEREEKREKNLIYTQEQCDSRRIRSERKHTRRMLSKKKNSKEVPPVVEPESLEDNEHIDAYFALPGKASGIAALTANSMDFSEIKYVYIDILLAFGNWIYQSHRRRNYKDKLSANLAFFMSAGVRSSDVLPSLIGILDGFQEGFEKGYNGVQPESLSEAMDSIDNVFNFVRNSEFLNKMRDLILSVLSLKIFNKDYAMEIVKYLGSIPKGTILDAAGSIFQGFRYLIRFGERLLSGESLYSVLMSDDPIQKMLDDCDMLIKRENTTYNGVPIEGFMDCVVYLQQINELIEGTKQIDTFISKFDMRYKRYQLQKVELAKLRHRVMVTMQCERNPPYGIVLHGPPGIGKSGLIRELSKWFSTSRGREWSESHTFHRTISSEYMEGYDPSKPILHYPELGNKKAALVKMTGDDMLLEIQSIVDSQPMAANMAFEGKGKVFITSELILIDTNNKFMHDSLVMHDTSAFRRRFTYIQATVKQEFRIEGGVGIDREKSYAHPSWTLDRYEFVVTKCIPTSGEPMERTLFSGDIYGLKTFLEGEFADHLINQERLKKNIESSRGLRDNFSEEEKYGKSDFPYNIEPEAFCVPSSLSKTVISAKLGIGHLGSLFTCVGQYALLSVIENVVWMVPAPTANWTCIRLLIFVLLICSFYPILTMLILISMFVLTFYVRSDFLKHLALNQIRGAKAHRAARYSYLRYNTPYNPFSSRTWWICGAGMVLYLGSSIDLLARAKKMYSKYCSPPTTFDTEGKTSDFFASSEQSQRMHEIEKEMEIMPNRLRFKTKLGNHWQDIQETDLANMKHTHDGASLYRSVSRNIRLVGVQVDGTNHKTHILGICGTLAVINAHVLKKCDKVIISISNTNHPREREDPLTGKPILITPLNSVKIAYDLVLFDTGCILFRDISIHFMPTYPTFENAKGYFGINPVLLNNCTGAVLNDKTGPYVIPNLITYDYPGHEPGVCGVPVIIENCGKAAIIGIHCGGMPSDDRAFAQPLTQNELNESINILRAKVPLIPIMSKGIEPEVYTELPNEKSVFRHIPLHNIEYYGRLMNEKIMVNNTSKQVRGPRYKEIRDTLDSVGIMFTQHFGKPMLKPMIVSGEYVSPTNNFFIKANTFPPQLDWKILGEVCDKYTTNVVEQLKAKGVTHLSPVTMEEAINGVRNDPYSRRMNAATSAGYGFKGKKSGHIPIVYDDTREATAALMHAVANILECYSMGQTVSPINSGSLKDEVRPLDKCISGSTRMFFITPLPFLVVSRMFLSPIITLMVEFCEVFGCAVGINMHMDGDRFIRSLTEFSEYLFEGDYKGYDINTPPDIARAANTVIYNIAKEFGYNDYSLQILLGILSDDMFPMMEVLKDLFARAGLVTSGRYGTAEVNSVRGILLLMYVWYSNENLCELNFFAYVLARVYGDDILAAIKKEVISVFNVNTYSAECKRLYNMTFTSVDKCENSLPYTNVNECSFLKRKFKIYTGTNLYVAPLDSNSIHKSLEWIAWSKNVSEPDQLLSNYQSMLYEIFFHTDREQLELLRHLFADILFTEFLVPMNSSLKKLPSYSELYARLILRETEADLIECESYEEGYSACLLNYPASINKMNCLSFTSHCGLIQPSDEYVNWIARSRKNIDKLKEIKENVNKRLMEIDIALMEVKGPDLPLAAMCNNSAIYENMQLYNACLPRRTLMIERQDLRATIDSIDNIIGKTLVFRPESYSLTEYIVAPRMTDTCIVEPESKEIDSLDRGTIPGSSINIIENVTDITGALPIQTSAGKSMSLNNGQMGEFPIEMFLERPVEIATGTIAVGADLSAELPVWDLITKHPSVRAKLKNFAFMRATLKCRVAISGSPFHTGRVMVSYHPHAGKNANLVAHTANGASALYRPVFLNYQSQAEGTKIMDVRANVPVEITCPFISPKPMGRLYNASSSALSAVTSFTDFADMGSLYVYTINAIGSVSSGSASAVGYSIYAWLENVELSVPTATQLAISTESFECAPGKDERETGPVERISSALLDLSVAASLIPVLKPFAVPAQIILGGVNAAAAHYGWSRPHIVSDPSYVKNRPFANSSNCIGSETTEMLSYDPKREVCTDGHPCASSTDDLAIATIASRETYFDTFTWANSDAAYTEIKSYYVHPQQSTVYADVGPTPCTITQPTALCFAVTPFEYWRGDITYRLDFVTSQYHRGKFAIWFEPNHHHGDLITADLSLNKNDVHIIDISVTNSVEIVVQWSSSYPWLKTARPADVYKISSMSVDYVLETGIVNGTLMMAPFVPLQSPDDSDIKINVFTKSNCILVNVMSDTLPTEREYITPESYTLADDEVSTVVLNPSTASVEDITKHYFGEQPVSFRACLKRYTTIEQSTRTTIAGAHQSMYMSRAIIPPVSPAYNVASNYSPINNLFSYLRYAYLGMRGGVRYRHRVFNSSTSLVTDRVSAVSLEAPVILETEDNWEGGGLVVTRPIGTVQYVTNITGPPEVELPFYSMNNFHFSFATNQMGTAVAGEMERDWVKMYRIALDSIQTGNVSLYVVRDFAIAEDFTFMRFEGAPYFTV